MQPKGIKQMRRSHSNMMKYRHCILTFTLNYDMLIVEVNDELSSLRKADSQKSKEVLFA